LQCLTSFADDTDYYANPGRAEGTWGGVDNDCDGVADEGSDATLVVTDSTLDASTSSGMLLVDIYAEVSGNSLSSNGAYGMECTGNVAFEVCEDNTFADNVSGDLLDCDACESD